MAQYLPVLLVSVSTNANADDSSLEPQPRGQVDYLSHQWEEEDVWRSWRSMTRQKNEITNGMRLENASWRTWWKQRNKLKTISPETLNWLKDSDVTWLYGPLHTAVDWSPPPKPKPDPTEVGKESSTEDKLDLAQAKHKSILKHRSITELLQSELPASSLFSPVESDEEELVEEDDKPVRPPLLHTKSAPHIHPPTHPALRKPSPPRVLPPAMASESSRLATSHKRHITFNTFVEQCIAIDSPRRPALSSLSASSDFIANDGPMLTNRTHSWDGRTSGRRWAGTDDDDDDDDVNQRTVNSESALSSDSDDALEICLPRSRSGSRSSGSTSKSALTLSNKVASKTIAPIAPTRLKTTGVGNSWAGGEWVSTRDEGGFHIEEAHLQRTSATVNLPASAAANTLVSVFDDDDDDLDESEVFNHESLYLSADADAYDYFAGPDIGVEFAPPREPRGRSITTNDTVEGERSRSRSKSKSRSRSRTPSPAILPPNVSSPSQSAAISVSANTRSGLLSPPPVAPPRGRDTSVSPSTSTSSSTSNRGRSATRTTSSSSDRERSRSGSSHTSPLGSLSPEYTGVRASTTSSSSGGGSSEFVYGGGVKGGKWDREKPPSASPEPKSSTSTTTISEDDNSNSSGTTTTRPTVQVADSPRPSVTPANSPIVATRTPTYVNRAKPPSSIASSSSSSSSSGSSSSSIRTPSTPPGKSDPAFATTAASMPRPKPHMDMLNASVDGFFVLDDDEPQPPTATATPANSPVIHRHPPSTLIVNGATPVKKSPPDTTTAKSIPISPPKSPGKQPLARNKPPIDVAPTSPAKATFQVGTPVMSVPGHVKQGSGSSPSENALHRTLSGPPSPTSTNHAQPQGHHQEGTIVGKAVGMVTSAGAYFGLWGGATATPASTQA
ncbi:DUF1752 domain-containing protein [Mycena indigotica]|uniref:DUF1752 domain-containing protein n=1 Tax=Mycena indigotica TaxID=2126181 RepID=A0A8H6W8S5_9AGAR|nr:DUF1752 domain-containing protein [Mycena indigotica]KAF7309929.1 DUF1752 domain-containing protein [Mycena indigotica]